MDPIDIAELSARGAKSKLEELRLEIYQRVNALGIGAQGLGGLTTVLDVKVLDYPTHAASLPVAVTSNGESVHETRPKAWRNQFAGIPVSVAGRPA